LLKRLIRRIELVHNETVSSKGKIEMKKSISQSAALILLLSLASAQENNGSKPVETITRRELQEHVHFLASDEMGGRVIYTEKFEIAARYCADQFRQAGLKPVEKKGGESAYLHEIPFVKKILVTSGLLEVKNGLSARTFDAAVETRYLFQADVSVFSKGKAIVFAGYGVSDPEHGWDDFDGLDLDGKIVLVLPGAPEQKGHPVLPEDIHEKLESTNPVQRWLFKSRVFEGLDARPAAVVIISDEIIDKSWDDIGGNYRGFRVYLAKDAHLPESEQNVVLISRSVAEALFEHQVYNPVAAETVDLDEYRTFELKDVDMTLEAGYELEEFRSWNVLGLVEGSDPVLKDEYVIVGGHLDHVPPVRGQIYNGADDNASGSAGVLEVAEAFALSAPPKRSILFCLWTGEEPLRGDACMGSKFFVEFPPFPLGKIKTYINLDMIGRSGLGHEQDRAHIIGSTKEMMPSVESLVKSVNAQTINWPIVFEEITSSDHRSFLDAGVPGFMFYSGRHKDVHTPDDDPEKIDYEKMEKISQLAYWITFELANGTKNLQLKK